MLSPLIFSVYTNDCTSGDPSVQLLIGLIWDSGESAYRWVFEHLAPVVWSQQSVKNAQNCGDDIGYKEEPCISAPPPSPYWTPLSQLWYPSGLLGPSPKTWGGSHPKGPVATTPNCLRSCWSSFYSHYSHSVCFLLIHHCLVWTCHQIGHEKTRKRHWYRPCACSRARKQAGKITCI